MIVAWHGESSLKEAALTRLREHRRMDQIAQKVYWHDGRGCNLGCLTHVNDNTHETAERLFGIEQRIGYWLESVFEGLPEGDCARWVVESADAIPVGADMSKCHHHLFIWIADESGLLAITDVNRAAIRQCRDLHVAALSRVVTDEEWRSARSATAAAAARSAAAAARSATAAWSAARSAESAWSAAESAAESAWSATWSAASAAWSLSWKKISAKSLEIFAAAPIVTEQPRMAADVKSELCCRQLWCPEGELVRV